jgi:hypothetical protein
LIPMSTQITVLGFDIREPLGRPSGWDDDRRSRFLIRQSVERPLSVDRSVWPALDSEKNEQNPLYLSGSVHQILRDRPELATGSSGDPVIIEVGAVEDEQSAEYWRRVFYGYLRPHEDTGITARFDDLGYDVADRYLLSGLSNCALSEQELAALRREWTDRINRFGLFEEAASATSFKDVCDRLIPEHAPFCAYRLRRVEVESSDSTGNAAIRRLGLSRPPTPSSPS